MHNFDTHGNEVSLQRLYTGKYLLRHRVATDISNGIGYRQNLVSLGIRNLNAKLLLEGHHHLHGIQGVQVQIVLELSRRSNLGVGHL